MQFLSTTNTYKLFESQLCALSFFPGWLSNSCKALQESNRDKRQRIRVERKRHQPTEHEHRGERHSAKSHERRRQTNRSVASSVVQKLFGSWIICCADCNYLLYKIKWIRRWENNSAAAATSASIISIAILWNIDPFAPMIRLTNI